MSQVKKILAAAALAAFLGAGIAGAATVSITPVVSQYFANDTALNNDTPSTPTIAANGAYISGGVYEISFAVGTNLTTTDTSAGFTGFGDAYFDVNQAVASLPAGLTPDANFGSTIYDRAVKYNTTGTKFQYTDNASGNNVAAGSGTPAGNPFFSAIVDNGTVGDLKSLEIAMGTGAYTGTDSRLTATQSTQNATLTGLDGNPLKAFDIFVTYDGSTAATLQPYANPATEGFGLHNNTTGLTTFFPAGTAGETYTLNSLAFGAVPEPASLGLLSIRAVGLIRRRRQA